MTEENILREILLKGEAKIAVIDAEEYDRLKRLEESVERSIKRLKHWRESILKIYPGGNEDTEEYTNCITLLESLRG